MTDKTLLGHTTGCPMYHAGCDCGYGDQEGERIEALEAELSDAVFSEGIALDECKARFKEIERLSAENARLRAGAEEGLKALHEGDTHGAWLILCSLVPNEDKE